MKLKVEAFMDNIKQMVLFDPDINVVISFSGGKDSSVLLALFVMAIRRGIISASQVEVIFADTALEIPMLLYQVKKVFKFVEDEIGMKATIVKRSDDNTYWTRFLGDGVFSSNWYSKWCVRLLKLNPIRKHFLSKDSFIIATGVRVDESELRGKNYKDANINALKKTTCDTAGECFVEFDKKDNVFHPILKWKNCDIWDFIHFYDHGLPLEDLDAIYQFQETIRLGCWMCSVSYKNDVVRQLTKQDKRFIPLYNIFRILTIYNNAERKPFDWVYTFRSSGANNRRDKQGLKWRPSYIKVEIRKHIFDMLIDAQKRTGFDLISEREIEIIKEKWEIRHDRYDPVAEREAPVKYLSEILANNEEHLLTSHIKKYFDKRKKILSYYK